MSKKTKWFLTFLYMILLVYFSLKGRGPVAHTSTIKEMMHNLGHIPAYAVLTYLLVWSFSTIQRAILMRVFLISFFYGVGMEILQSFTPDRTPSVKDALLNALGAGVMLWLLKRGYLRISYSILTDV